MPAARMTSQMLYEQHVSRHRHRRHHSLLVRCHYKSLNLIKYSRICCLMGPVLEDEIEMEFYELSHCEERERVSLVLMSMRDTVFFLDIIFLNSPLFSSRAFAPSRAPDAKYLTNTETLFVKVPLCEDGRKEHLRNWRLCPSEKRQRLNRPMKPACFMYSTLALACCVHVRFPVVLLVVWRYVSFLPLWRFLPQLHLPPVSHHGFLKKLQLRVF